MTPLIFVEASKFEEFKVLAPWLAEVCNCPRVEIRPFCPTEESHLEHINGEIKKERNIILIVTENQEVLARYKSQAFVCRPADKKVLLSDVSEFGFITFRDWMLCKNKCGNKTAKIFVRARGSTSFSAAPVGAAQSGDPGLFTEASSKSRECVFSTVVQDICKLM